MKLNGSFGLHISSPWETELYNAMVRNSLQKVVFVNFLLTRNEFRTNYKAIFCGTAVDCSIIYTNKNDYSEGSIVFLIVALCVRE